MGIGPIPWDAMMKYAEFLGLNRRMTRVWCHVIREMDEYYLKMQRDEKDKRERQLAREREQKAKEIPRQVRTR
jgi:hypothetical protein